MAQPPRPSGFVREDAITDHFYRDSLPTNGFNQKGVDLTLGARVAVTYENNPTTGVQTVVETRAGGTWLQIKALAPVKIDAAGVLDLGDIQKRIDENIGLAVNKAEGQVRLPKATTRESVRDVPAAPAPDGTPVPNDRYRLHLESPDALQIHVEVPGFENLPANLQQELRDYATRTLQAYSPEIASTVRVEAPPEAGRLVIPGAIPTTEPPAVKLPAGSGALNGTEEIAIAAQARAAYAEAAAKEPGLGAEGGKGAFLLVTVGGALLLYATTPDGERVEALSRYAADTLVGLTAEQVLSRVGLAVAATGVGFALPLAYDTPPSRDVVLDNQVNELMPRLYPDLKYDDPRWAAHAEELRRTLDPPPDDPSAIPPIERRLPEVRPARVPLLEATAERETEAPPKPAPGSQGGLRNIVRQAAIRAAGEGQAKPGDGKAAGNGGPDGLRAAVRQAAKDAASRALPSVGKPAATGKPAEAATSRDAAGAAGPPRIYASPQDAARAASQVAAQAAAQAAVQAAARAVATSAAALNRNWTGPAVLPQAPFPMTPTPPLAAAPSSSPVQPSFPGFFTVPMPMPPQAPAPVNIPMPAVPSGLPTLRLDSFVNYAATWTVTQAANPLPPPLPPVIILR